MSNDFALGFWYENDKGELRFSSIPRNYAEKQYSLKKLTDEVLISIREEPLVRTDIPKLISHGLDPMVYKTKPFENGAGEAIFEIWWGDVMYWLFGDHLVPQFDFMKAKTFVDKGLAASSSFWRENRMY